MGGAVLIYTMTRNDTKCLADLLNQNEIEAEYYHGKIPKADKERILEQFKQKQLWLPVPLVWVSIVVMLEQ